MNVELRPTMASSNFFFENIKHFAWNPDSKILWLMLIYLNFFIGMRRIDRMKLPIAAGSTEPHEHWTLNSSLSVIRFEKRLAVGKVLVIENRSSAFETLSQQNGKIFSSVLLAHWTICRMDSICFAESVVDNRTERHIHTEYLSLFCLC